MRLPRFLLDREVVIEGLAGTTGMGSTLADPVRRAASVDEAAKLSIDQRPDSDTLGQQITTAATVIVQLENYAAPGSFITLPDGERRQVANARKHQHRDAPNHAEMRVV